MKRLNKYHCVIPIPVLKAFASAQVIFYDLNELWKLIKSIPSTHILSSDKS